MRTDKHLKIWLQKWRWYERNSLPWRRLLLHYQAAKRGAFFRWPVHGEVLEMLQDGRLMVGKDTLFEPHVWITGSPDAHIQIGSGTFLNLGVMIAAQQEVTIGDHCMLANGCLITDADHRFDDFTKPITWQGFQSKGPTHIGDNVWCGANVTVTSGVSIGERCVIGANSVVNRDIPAYSVAAGVPAKVIRSLEHS